MWIKDIFFGPNVSLFFFFKHKLFTACSSGEILKEENLES